MSLFFHLKKKYSFRQFVPLLENKLSNFLVGVNISLPILRLISFKGCSCLSCNSGWIICQLVIKWFSHPGAAHLIIFCLLAADDLILQTPNVFNSAWFLNMRWHTPHIQGQFFFLWIFNLPWLAWEGRGDVLMALFYTIHRDTLSTSLCPLLCFPNPFQVKSRLLHNSQWGQLHLWKGKGSVVLIFIAVCRWSCLEGLIYSPQSQ